MTTDFYRPGGGRLQRAVRILKRKPVSTAKIPGVLNQSLYEVEDGLLGIFQTSSERQAFETMNLTIDEFVDLNQTSN